MTGMLLCRPFKGRPRRFAHATTLSLFFLYERIRNLFASVDRRNDHKEGAAGDYEAEFAVANVAFVVWRALVCYVGM
jgi:hypothetical protein